MEALKSDMGDQNAKQVKIVLMEGLCKFSCSSG